MARTIGKIIVEPKDDKQAKKNVKKEAVKEEKEPKEASK